jgi:uncharacterized protein YydD (DUF2326 family)
MLAEIRCDLFRGGPIAFRPSLNVVLGDENATNSIGKSTLLMIVDFAFGGSTLVAHNTDLVVELGHHDYFFTFRFGESVYRFRRGTNNANVIYTCNEDFQPQQALDLAEYTAFLKAAYALPLPDLTFRGVVGPYLRVWGKDNLSVERPLHASQAQPARECISTLLKLFQRYEALHTLSSDLQAVEDRTTALSQAVEHQIVPAIGKREYAANAERIAAVTSELADIRANLAQYATSLTAIVNRDVLHLKLEKDRLLDQRLTIAGRLQRVRRNLGERRYIKSPAFRSLVEFFPQVNQERLGRIEEFHNDLARILRAELRESEASLLGQLEEIDASLKDIDEQMGAKLKSVDDPGALVDKVFEAAVELQGAKDANERFEVDSTLKAKRAELRAALATEKDKALRFVEAVINDEMRRIVTDAFGEERKSPRLQLRDKSYSFEVYDDTGTGTAYAGLVVFDLTIFTLTPLPVVAHDSILFKNIENNSVASLLQVYMKSEKQSFLAIDEVEKYGHSTAELLRDQSVIQLRNDKVLYKKDWRR